MFDRLAHPVRVAGPLAMLAAWALVPLCAQAQSRDDQAQADDPNMIILRSVMPRAAYREVPLDDHPVRARATVFPARAFHSALDSALARVATDADLGQRASMGLAGGGNVGETPGAGFTGDAGRWSAFAKSTLMKSPTSGGPAIGAMGGASGGAGGRVVEVTSRLGTMLPNAIDRAVQPTTPPGG